jgi:mRNA interferase RelE/StbE
MPIAEQQLKLISDRRLQAALRTRLKRLQNEPEKQGKPLTDELAGYRSIRAAGQRYRIIYKIEEERVLVLVVMVGIRKEGDKKDAYAQAIKLARLGLLELE